MTKARDLQKLQISELEELRNEAYETANITKERTINEFKNLPYSLWLTGRVHKEGCDRSFSVNRLETRNCVHFFMKKRMERKR